MFDDGMHGPVFHATLKLAPELARPRLIASWRPTLSQGVPGQMHFGVAFAHGPQQGEPGQEFDCSLRFLTWPEPGCTVFVSGTEFVVHEGMTVVGRGKITRIDDRISPE